MKAVATFLEAGWDLACEAVNGTEDVWSVAEGDYPRLIWELEETPVCPVPVIELDETDFNDAIADGVVLVDFYATWCSHCRTQAPILDDVAEQVQGSALVAKLDIDEAPSVAQAYDVTAVPTLIVFRNGGVFERLVGVTQAPGLIAAIQSAIDYQEPVRRMATPN
jgi:thioredoxin 1